MVKVVVIEEVEEPEFIQGQCRQISIFMSPLNVHINWHPITAKVIYRQHHAGKYLVAWHPKSSTENERTSVGYQYKSSRILVRQIAGFMARRIKNYAVKDVKAEMGSELGFIKFGSRVDVFVPLHWDINVQLEQRVRRRCIKVSECRVIRGSSWIGKIFIKGDEAAGSMGQWLERG